MEKEKDQGVVIQYLESSMSNKLLSKFPHNSGFGFGFGFGFDSGQSSLWSPLVPRVHSLACLNPPKSPDLSKKKLCFDKVSNSSSVNKKICSFGLNLNAKLHKKKMKMKLLKCNDNYPLEIQSPPSKNKGWKKMLKMTSKQFKKRKDHFGQRHPISRVTLADYLQSQDI